MRSLLALVLFASLAEAAPRPMTPDALLAMKRLGDFDASPDGKWVVYSVATPHPDDNKSTSALWLQPLDGSAPPRQITGGVKHDGAPKFSPDGRRIAFVSDRDGAPQIFILELGGGEARAITDAPGGFGGPMWSPDGKWILAASEVFPDCKDLACDKARAEKMEKSKVKARVIERLMFRHWDQWRDGKRSHLFAVDAGGVGKPRDLTPGDLDAPPFSVAGDAAYDVSPDGNAIVYAATHVKNEALSTNDDVYEVSIAANATPRCLSCANPGRDTHPRYSPDGRSIVWMQQKRDGRESDKIDLVVLDRKSRAQKVVTEGFAHWASEPVFTRDGRRLVFSAVVGGRKQLLAVDSGGGNVTTLVAEHASGDALPLADGTMLFSQSSLVHPAELYRAPIRENAAPEAVTHLNDTSAIAMGAVSERHVKLPDASSPLHAFVITPPGFDAHKKYPAILFIHGGPEGAWEDAWSYRWNPEVLAGADYVIYLPNPRGSEGYGQKWVEAVLQNWGGTPFDDLMRATDDLESLPFVDKKHIGAAGASYGGFMINWIQGHTRRFVALFCHDGVSNQETMYATEELYFAETEFGGPPWASDQYKKWSPAAFANDFATPELIVHGERDFRVPVEQGYLMFSLLQRKGVPSKLIVFPDENHWVLKPGDSRLWYAEMIDWFHRWLGGGAADPKALESAFSVTK
jgi:dipeptidyl aminopeptidase/acylaminoacyl peptidase